MLLARSVLKTFVRCQHAKTHWSRKDKVVTSCDRALQNFDDFYGNVYGARWKSMRVALLCEKKYVAMVNNFGDDTKTAEMLENDGAMNIRSVYEVQKRNIAEMKTGVFATDNIKSIDSRVTDFIDAKKDSEYGDIYSDKERVRPKDEAKASESSQIDYKKPLERVIEEDSDIDYGRMVDPNYGTSGLHEFIPATKIKGMEDFVFESEHYRYYSNTTDFPLKIEMDHTFNIPQNLQLYCYDKGNLAEFRQPTRTSTGVSSHFFMDGASILPPLALNIKPGDYVLDACAAPGGKSLLMLQTHLPRILVSSDLSLSRCNRLRRMFKEFIYDFDKSWDKHRCIIRHEDARLVSEYGVYDKILCDVPCTTDRHSVNSDENNIFRANRIKERLKIPEQQAAILTNCIRLLKPGGSLVYSTCTLSPVQNDGVVHMALSTAFKDHRITMTINDLSLAMQPLYSLMKFEHPRGLKYGQLVVPFLPANFGPMYFCKMTRN